MIGKRFGLNWQKSSEKVNNQKKGKEKNEEAEQKPPVKERQTAD